MTGIERRDYRHSAARSQPSSERGLCPPVTSPRRSGTLRALTAGPSTTARTDDAAVARSPRRRGAVLVAGGILAEPARRPRPPPGVRALLRPRVRRRRRLQRGVSHPELPAEPLRGRRALRLLHPGLCDAGRERRARDGGSGRRRRRRAARARRRHARARRRRRDAVPDRRDRPRLHRRQARPHDPARTHPVSGRRPARRFRPGASASSTAITASSSPTRPPSCGTPP